MNNMHEAQTTTSSSAPSTTTPIARRPYNPLLVRVRLTPAEHEWLTDAAQALGQSQADVLKRACFSREILVPMFSEADANVVLGILARIESKASRLINRIGSDWAGLTDEMGLLSDLLRTNRAIRKGDS